ncbi:MAG: hypothetical protein MUE56_04245, partial [Ignavibacteria bacterium]|nr:hypothetical protein [Ignavibacteria bacterium]
MRKIIYAIAFFLTINSILLVDYCRSQWVQQSVPVTQDYFRDMKFLNANIGFISHNSNVILRTSNGGFNWQTFNIAMRGIATVDSMFVYGAGFYNGYGKLFKSTDAGITWDSLLQNSYPFTSLYFFNRDTGLISGSDSFNDFVWRTTDGGQTKQLLSTISSSAGGGKLIFLKEKINEEYYGWLYYPGNYSSWHRTTNSGVNWTAMPNIPSNYVNGLFFINKDTGWATIGNTTNYVRYTTYGGYNWVNQNLPNNEICVDIYFSNSRIGWISCYVNQKIYATTNGGIIWGTQNVSGNISSKLYFLDSLRGWAQTSGNTISRTINGGGPITEIGNNGNILASDYKLFQNYPNP